MNSDIYILALELGEQLKKRCAWVTAAESCTGGGVASALTDIAGCSSWFEVGYVVYSYRQKEQLLGVSKATLAAHGAVSEAVVRAMVTGALHASGADYAIAISGIAGPGGGTPEKPVGTVWFAWQGPQSSAALCMQFDGDRRSVREQAVEFSLRQLLHLTHE